MIDARNILPEGKKRKRAPPLDPSSAGSGFSALRDGREELHACAGGWADDVVLLLFRTRKKDGKLWLTGSSPALDAIVFSDRQRLKQSVPLGEVVRPVVKTEQGTTHMTDEELCVPCDGIPCVLKGCRDQRWPVMVSIAPNGRGVALPLDSRCRQQLAWEDRVGSSDCEEEEGAGTNRSDSGSDSSQDLWEARSSDSSESDLDGFIVGEEEEGCAAACCGEHEQLRAFAMGLMEQGHARMTTAELMREHGSGTSVAAFGKVLARHPALFRRTGARSTQRGWHLLRDVRECACCGRGGR